MSTTEEETRRYYCTSLRTVYQNFPYQKPRERNWSPFTELPSLTQSSRLQGLRIARRTGFRLRVCFTHRGGTNLVLTPSVQWYLGLTRQSLPQTTGRRHRQSSYLPTLRPYSLEKEKWPERGRHRRQPSLRVLLQPPVSSLPLVLRVLALLIH